MATASLIPEANGAAVSFDPSNHAGPKHEPQGKNLRLLGGMSLLPVALTFRSGEANDLGISVTRFVAARRPNEAAMQDARVMKT
jgi:hypothetical protein